MKIAILGGSFDPPHLGHLFIAQEVLRLLALDQVWLMPCASHAFNKQLSPVKKRWAMCQLLQTDKIVAHDWEIKRGGVSYTWETLQQLEDKYPQHTFSWIIGSDQLADFTQWRCWQELLQTKQLVIFPRKNNIPTIKRQLLRLIKGKKLPENIILMEGVQLNSSASSIIRQRIEQQLSIQHLVGEKINLYLQQYAAKNKQ